MWNHLQTCKYYHSLCSLDCTGEKVLLVPQVELALLLGHVLPHVAVAGLDVELELLVVHGAGHGNGLLLEDHLNIIIRILDFFPGRDFTKNVC